MLVCRVSYCTVQRDDIRATNNREYRTDNDDDNNDDDADDDNAALLRSLGTWQI